MAYDEGLAVRISELTHDWVGLEEKKMFGGMGFLLHGHMCVGVWKDSLVLRVGEHDAELKQNPHITDFDITGRAMKGWVLAAPEAIDDDAEFERMVALAREFVLTLPEK